MKRTSCAARADSAPAHPRARRRAAGVCHTDARHTDCSSDGLPMPMPFGSQRTFAEVTEEERRLLAQYLERQGYLELATAHIFGAAVAFAPTLDDKILLADQTKEELGHLEAIALIYAELGAGDLLKVVQSPVADSPSPTSWLETAVVQCLFDRAAKFHIAELRASSFRPVADVAGWILSEEEAHEAAGEQILLELCRANPRNVKAGQAHLERWLPISLNALGKPSARRSARAVELGLRAREYGVVMRDYLDDVRIFADACGLHVPNVSPELRRAGR